MEDSKHWDMIAEKYDNLYSNLWSKYEDHLLEQELSIFLNNKKILNVLDLGCGTGFGFSLLKSLNIKFSYYGLDISNEMLSVFNKKYKNEDVHLIKGSILEIDKLFLNKKFDLIISLNTAMSFSGNVKQSIDLVYSLMDNDSYAFLSFLNKSSLRRKIRLEYKSHESFRSRGTKVADGSVTAIVVSEQEIFTHAENAGFKHIAISYQSVLGGVIESQKLISFEKKLIKLFPKLGHILNLKVIK